MLQYVAVCCSVLQCVAVCCSVSQWVAVPEVCVVGLEGGQICRYILTSFACEFDLPPTQRRILPVHIQILTKYCNTLQHTATHCNTLQHTLNMYRKYVLLGSWEVEYAHASSAEERKCLARPSRGHALARTRTTTGCSLLLQFVAVCCSVLQCVAVCCSVLQCVTVCCSVLQGVTEVMH